MSCLKSSTHICGHNEAVPWLQRYEKDICLKQLDLPVILSSYSEMVYRSVTLLLTVIVETDHDGLI